MTLNETQKIIDFLLQYYDSWREPEQIANAYHFFLSKYEFEDVKNGTKRLIESDSSTWNQIPLVGKIIKYTENDFYHEK